jgi:DNA modification methylase
VKKVFGHPFSKPYELTQFLTELCSMPEQLILEPFAGGGSLAVKMLHMQRRVVAIEKETHHFNGLVENIKQEYYLELNPKTRFK